MIHIAFAPDDNYVMPTAVAMESIFENRTEAENIVIHLIFIEGHLSGKNIALLSRITEKFGSSIETISVPVSMLEGFPQFRHGLSAYLRILSPYLFPKLDKLLYLDGDIVVEKSLSGLYNINMNGKEWAAVADLKPIFTPGYVESIGFNPKKHAYINSGIMLLNLDLLRKRNIKDKVRAYLGKYKNIIYHEDQDILNCCCDDVIIIEPKYNSEIHLWTKRISQCRQLWTEDEILEAKCHPVIIHYLGGFKPWVYELPHPFKERWYYYLDNTEFKGWRPQKTFRKLLSKIKLKILMTFK